MSQAITQSIDLQSLGENDLHSVEIRIKLRSKVNCSMHLNLCISYVADICTVPQSTNDGSFLLLRETCTSRVTANRPDSFITSVAERRDLVTQAHTNRERKPKASACEWDKFSFINWVDNLNSLRRRANARNVSFRIPLRWSIHIINPVDTTKLSPHRGSTTVSLENYPLYSLVNEVAL